MATAQTMDASDAPGDTLSRPAISPGKSRKALLIGGVAVLAALGAGGAYYMGALDTLMGRGSTSSASVGPGFVDVAEVVANLNAGPRRTAFVKLKARLELSSKSDEAAVQALQPRVQDLFQTYLRDMRPDELRGSAGTYRLREELIARANIALAPARVTEILFIELLVQ